jgi:hypothetical protein
MKSLVLVFIPCNAQGHISEGMYRKSHRTSGMAHASKPNSNSFRDTLQSWSGVDERPKDLNDPTERPFLRGLECLITSGPDQTRITQGQVG